MKTLNCFLLLLFSICLIVACDVSQVEDEFQEENQSLENLTLENSSKYKGKKHRNGKLRIERDQDVVAFEAEFSTTSSGLTEDERCNESRLLETQEGDGHAKNIGDFNILFTFCVDLSDVFPDFGGDGQLTDNEALPYYKGESTITFSNGDELFGKISGAVLPTDKPRFDFEFMDPMVFTDGTGRFKDARGGGLTNSFVVFMGGTEHEFSGVIVLPKHRGNSNW